MAEKRLWSAVHCEPVIFLNLCIVSDSPAVDIYGIMPPIELLMIANSDSAAYQAGQIVGGGLFCLLVFLGVLKCVKLMRRPTTHTLCVFSLALLLFTWMVSGIGSILKDQYDVQPGILLSLYYILISLMVLGVLVTAIVGLAIYDKNRYNQGRAQAVWALVISSLFFLVMIGSFVMAMHRNSQSFADTEIQRADGEAIEVEEFNFSISPGKKWVQFDPKIINEDSCLGLRMAKPEMYSVVTAEKSVVELDLGQLSEIIKSNMTLNSKVLSSSQAQVELNGMKFKVLNTRARPNNANFVCEYEHWITTRGGFVWQIMFWTVGKRDELSKQAREVVESFRLLDPDLELKSGNSLKNVDRPEYGYQTGLDLDSWRSWDDGNLNSLVDFSAQIFNEAMVVVPVRFPAEAPDLKVLSQALTGKILENPASEEKYRIRTWDPGHGGEGREMTIQLESSGIRFNYIFRIARLGNTAHLIAGWAVADSGNLDLVRETLDSVKLSPVEGDAPELSPNQKAEMALLLNDFGLAYLDKGRPREAVEWFKMSYDYRVDANVLGNAGDAFLQADLVEEGLDYMAPHVESHPSHSWTGLNYARLLVSAGKLDAAEQTFKELLEAGIDDHDDFLLWLQHVNEIGHYDVAIRTAEAWVKRMPTYKARLWLAQTFSAADDAMKAVEVLESLHEEYPSDLNVSYNLGECYNQAGESLKAAETAEEILSAQQDSARALMILGWSQYQREWYRDAKKSFEAAAKLLPDDEDVKEAIRTASASLGQGDNSDIKEPVELVAMPEEVVSALEKHQAPEGFGDGQPEMWLMRAQGYHFEKGKPGRTTYFRKIKILTNDGARNYSSIAYRFDPLSERIYMNRLVVRNEEGEIISRAKESDYYVRDENDGTASDGKVFHAKVAGVKPGVTVEWEVTKEDRAAADEFHLKRDLYISSVPSVCDAVFVTGDVEQVRSKIENGEPVEFISGDGFQAWIHGPLEAFVDEYMSLPVERFVPALWLGDKNADWAKDSLDYLEQIKGQMEVDESLVKLAKELTKDAGTDSEKIAALVQYVQKEISYEAIEFGVRGRRPNKAGETLRLRYGDCKDMSLLVHQMLSAVGIESHLTLVDTSWDIQPEVPSIDQFNHMVVHIPSLGDRWLVDPTDNFLDHTKCRADNLWGGGALILDPANPRLIELPVHADEGSCGITSVRSIKPDGDDWDVKETLHLTGYAASWMRAAFKGYNLEDRQARVQSILSRMGNAQVHAFEFKNFEELGKPAVLVIDYTVRRGITDMGTYLSGEVPALWERDYLASRFIKNRKTPFRVMYPTHFVSEVSILLPDEATQRSFDSLNDQKESAYCQWSLKADEEDSVIKLRMEFAGNTGTFDASEYADFHDAKEAAPHAWDKPVTWVMPAKDKAGQDQ